MADTENPEWVFLEDFIGIEGVEEIAHWDGTVERLQFLTLTNAFARMAINGTQVQIRCR
jgi:hypothetical protein